MNRLPSRKVIFLIVILLAITLGVLWYVGAKSQSEQREREEKYLEQLTKKNESINSVVQNNLEKKGALKRFDPAILYGSDVIAISTMETVSASSLKEYAENMSQALKPLSQKRENEARTMLSAIENQDRTKIKEIVAARITFEEIARNLLTIKPPADVAPTHKEMISTIKHLSALAGQMEKALDEPVLALQSGQYYLQEATDLLGLVDKLNKYLLDTKAIGPEEKISIYFETE